MVDKVYRICLTEFGTGICRRVVSPDLYKELTIKQWYPHRYETWEERGVNNNRDEHNVEHNVEHRVEHKVEDINEKHNNDTVQNNNNNIHKFNESGGYIMNYHIPLTNPFFLVFNVMENTAVITLERVLSEPVRPSQNGSNTFMENGGELYVFSACAPWRCSSRFHNSRAFFVCQYDDCLKELHIFKTMHWCKETWGIFHENGEKLDMLNKNLPFKKIHVVQSMDNINYTRSSIMYPLSNIGRFSYEDALCEASRDITRVEPKFMAEKERGAALGLLVSYNPISNRTKYNGNSTSYNKRTITRTSVEK